MFAMQFRHLFERVLGVAQKCVYPIS